MVEVACEIDFKNTVIEFELFEDCSDIICVIAENLQDDFVENIFVLVPKMEDPCFWKTGAFIIVSFVLNKCFNFLFVWHR